MIFTTLKSEKFSIRFFCNSITNSSNPVTLTFLDSMHRNLEHMLRKKIIYIDCFKKVAKNPKSFNPDGSISVKVE
jgi:hypothetical protein